MDIRTEFPGVRCLLLAAAFSVLGCGAMAQTSSLPAGQVSGALLQTWLDQTFAYAGVHLSSGCNFMNAGDTKGRVLFLSCPNGWSEKLVGTARVVGDTLCTNFPIPNQPPREECLTWHAMGEQKFAQRPEGAASTFLYVLSVVPMPGK
jgi:hypothetical protein